MGFSSWWLKVFRSAVALGAAITLTPSGRPTAADHWRDVTSEPAPSGAATFKEPMDRTRPGDVNGSRPQRNRRVFAYTAGEFHPLEGGRWVERRFDGPDSHFIETARTPEFVELYDRDRDLLVRLRSDHGEWLSRETNEWVPWPGSEGHWK